ncbi:hypothetical protein DERF_014506 [Dermatophagoides farinae]|uniref:Uncharacterized protein n=1 Tax=Dermatophagoides farinae TaxID=6954 RepID=A0A922HMG4_DERFA|nr:hypothetical protein DERF_014506 [Dermatophagoides farinae]
MARFFIITINNERMEIQTQVKPKKNPDLASSSAKNYPTMKIFLFILIQKQKQRQEVKNHPFDNRLKQFINTSIDR